MQTVFDAIIVGAGPAGASAAILLARAGWNVLLIEKQLFPRRKVCGECIAASNLPLLDALGIGGAFAASAGPELRQVALMHRDSVTVADLPPALWTSHRWGRALGRETLDTLLLEQARVSGAHVLQPCSVQAVGGAPGNWRCDVRCANSMALLTFHARIVIAANGSWEALPSERATHETVHRASDLLAFKANFSGARLAHSLLPVLSFTGGYGGMVNTGADETTLAFCVRRDHLEALRHQLPGLSAGEAGEEMLKRECAGVREALEVATRDGPWLAAGPLHPGIRVDTDDGFLRIGNAAGEAHPIIGEGMSMALQAAWLLCAHLLGARDRATLEDAAWQRTVHRAYAAQWRRQFAPRLRLAAVFAHLAMRPGGAAILARAVHLWPALLTLGAKWGGKARGVINRGTVSDTTIIKDTT